MLGYFSRLLSRICLCALCAPLFILLLSASSQAQDAGSGPGSGGPSASGNDWRVFQQLYNYVLLLLRGLMDYSLNPLVYPYLLVIVLNLFL